MCYYYGRKVNKAEYDRLIALEEIVCALNQDLVIYKGFDHNFVDIIRAIPGTHQTERVKMQWGFLPSYLKNDEEVKRFRFGYKNERGQFIKGYTTLNATSENLMDRMYTDAALHRRCLIPMNLFYEWRHVQVVGKSGKLLKTPEKFPYMIEMINEPEFYVAGIWQPWTNKETKITIDTFSLITTEANSLMKQVHNSKERMPTVLPGKVGENWLYNDLTIEEVMDTANYQVASAEMRATPLHKDFLKRENPHEMIIYKEVTAIAA